MRITEIREKTFPISSPIRNAYIDFSKMTLSLPFGGFPDGVKVEDSHITMPDLPGIGFEGKSDLYKEMKALAA
jgi:L-alanine-DL-glutamate epimerase-like enolase superfamily enzyme